MTKSTGLNVIPSLRLILLLVCTIHSIMAYGSFQVQLISLKPLSLPDCSTSNKVTQPSPVSDSIDKNQNIGAGIDTDFFRGDTHPCPECLEENVEDIHQITDALQDLAPCSDCEEDDSAVIDSKRPHPCNGCQINISSTDTQNISTENSTEFATETKPDCQNAVRNKDNWDNQSENQNCTQGSENVKSERSRPTCVQTNGCFSGHIKVCLAHHQTPPPAMLTCTFGAVTTALEFDASSGELRHDDIIIPFAFSWPGKFSLSVSVILMCSNESNSKDANSTSELIVAQELFPSDDWTRVPQEVKDKSLDDAIKARSRNLHRVLLERLNSEHAERNNQNSFQDISRLEKSKHHLQAQRVDRVSDGQSISYTLSSLQPKLGPLFPGSVSVEEISLELVDSNSETVTLSRAVDTVLIRRGGKMTAGVRVVCDENYYGKNCSKFCRPRDDLLGHYNCSLSGQPVCLEGWTGKDCTEAVCSGCLPSHGRCVSPDNCLCRAGWFGEKCEKCRTAPGCLHGHCKRPGECKCIEGWGGMLCDVEQLYCLRYTPCRHGGQCVQDNAHNYTCICPDGYTGTHCEVPECHKHFCLHGGTCHTAEGTRYCLCPPPFSGPRCQHFQKNSVPEPSKTTLCEGQDCNDRSPKTKATEAAKPAKCLPGSKGDLCDEHGSSSGNTNVCSEDMVCQNSGECKKSSRSGRPYCKCSKSFTGEFCETKIDTNDPCSNHVCLNGGRCVVGRARVARCVCLNDYTGALCQKKVGACARAPCQHGGTCVEHNGEVFCACRKGFDGQFCEKKRQKRKTSQPQKEDCSGSIKQSIGLSWVVLLASLTILMACHSASLSSD